MVDACDENCTICLDPLGSEAVTLSGCGHRFHAACAVHALQHNSSCPLCRYKPPSCDDAWAEEELSRRDDRRREYSEWMARRNRAIVSALRRVRRNTASDEIRRAAEQYRFLAVQVTAARRSIREIDAQADAYHRGGRAQFRIIFRQHRRGALPIRRRSIQRHTRMAQLNIRRQEVGDVLARECGFTDIAPEL